MWARRDVRAFVISVLPIYYWAWEARVTYSEPPLVFQNQGGVGLTELLKLQRKAEHMILTGLLPDMRHA